MLRILSLLAVAGLTLSLASGCGGTSSASSGEDSTYTPRTRQITVDFTHAQRQALHHEAEFTGDLLPRRISRISPEIEGVVREIPQVGTRFQVKANGKQYDEQLGITYGQRVRKGEVLVRLDTTDYNLALRMAQTKLAKAKADLARVESGPRAEEVRRLTALRNDAQVRYDQAVRNQTRIRQLLFRNAISKSDYEKANMEAATARATLNSSKANLEAAQAGPTAEEIAVQKALVAQAEAEVAQSQRQVEKATIRAPFDGVITGFHVEVGDRVSPASGAIVELMDLRYLVAEVGVPENYIGRVHVRDRAQVSVAGATQAVPGLVVAINELVEPKTRTFRVRIAIDNAEGRFKAGQFARVTLQMSGGETAPLIVPNDSIVLVEGQPHVYTVEGEQVRKRAVQVGLSSGTSSEILRGLTEGDRVVASNPGMLEDGMKVTVKAAVGQ